MMKYTVIFATLLVCTFANPLFPHFNYQNNPTNMDDGWFQGNAQQGAPQNQGGDSQDQQFGNPGLAPQAATTMAPGDSSSGSSSEEDTAAATMAPAAPVGPIFGGNPAVAPQEGFPGAGTGTGGSSDTNTNMINQVEASPVGADPGNTSGQQFDANTNPLNMQKPAHQKQQESRQSSLALAGTTLFLVAGVAATAAVTYKYKDAIRGRLGL